MGGNNRNSSGPGYIISTDTMGKLSASNHSPDHSPTSRPQFVNADGVKVGYPQRKNRVSGEIDVKVVKQPDDTLTSNNFNFETDPRRPSKTNPEAMSFGIKTN